MQAKHIIGNFEMFFNETKTFLTPKIVLSSAKGNFIFYENYFHYL
jgi:hypothetical protein